MTMGWELHISWCGVITLSKCFPYLEKFVVSFAYHSVYTMESLAGKKHNGIDLVGRGNKTIVSCTEGRVLRAEKNNKSYGNYVWIANNDGTGALYAHMSSLSVNKGDKVQPKTVLGVEGNTGNSTGSHLHLGISSSQDWSITHSKKLWISPAVWLGINESSAKKGAVLNGEGMVSGLEQGVTYANSSFYTVGSLDIVQSETTYSIKDEVGVTSDWLYGRRYRVLVDCGNGTALDVSNLRCVFDIQKTSYQQANSSKVVLYNLSPEDENKIIKQGQRIVIEAGYNGNYYGKIFDGQIIQPVRSREGGTDYKLTLVAMDSDRFTSFGLISQSIVAQQSSREVINSCINNSANPVEPGTITEDVINYPRGKVLFGKASNYLAQIARSLNGTYYSEDGKVNIIQPQTLPTDEIFDLSPENGLLSSPSQTEYGVSFECLLNPSIHIGSLVRIDNKVIEGKELDVTSMNIIRALDSVGIYRVISISYIGDTRGNDWKCKAEAISQSGILPGMATDGNSYIYGVN